MKYLLKYRFNKLLFIIVFCIVFYLFYNISYTDDYSVYEAHYNTNVITSYSDLGFITLENISKHLGFNFREFTSAAILLQLILFSFICVKFHANPSFCLSFLVCISYVQMANQMRYYLAFPFFIIACYYIFCAKNRFIGIILSLISFSLHSGIIILMSFYPLYFFILNKQLKFRKIVLVYIIIGTLCYIGFQTGFNILLNIDDKYEAYTKSLASPLGMAFALLTPLYYLLIINFLIKKCCYNFSNQLLNLIIILAFFPIIWFIVSIGGLQVINARYINIFLIIWIICIYRLVMISNIHYKSLLLSAIFFGGIIIKYILPYYLFGNSDFDKIGLIWVSKFI